MYSHDNRVVITLDAGGTNLVFGAMQANKFIVEPITLPSHAEDHGRATRKQIAKGQNIGESKQSQFHTVIRC